MGDFTKAEGHPADKITDLREMIELGQQFNDIILNSPEFEDRHGPWASFWMLVRDGANELEKRDPKD